MGRDDARPRSAGDHGFTLLEALVALAVMAAGLAAIGQLTYSSLSAARRAETRLTLTSAARAAMTALPERQGIRNGTTTGQIFDDRWRLAAAPFTGVAAGGPATSGWAPQALQLTVSDAAGDTLVVETLRLRRLGGP